MIYLITLCICHYLSNSWARWFDFQVCYLTIVLQLKTCSNWLIYVQQCLACPSTDSAMISTVTVVFACFCKVTYLLWDVLFHTNSSKECFFQRSLLKTSLKRCERQVLSFIIKKKKKNIYIYIHMRCKWYHSTRPIAGSTVDPDKYSSDREYLDGNSMQQCSVDAWPFLILFGLTVWRM